MKLHTKIALLFSICISVAFSCLLLMVRDRILTSNQTSLEDLNTQIVESKANEIGSWLNQRISEIRVISQTEALRSMETKSLQTFINRLNQNVGEHYGNEYGTFAAGTTNGLGYVCDEQTIDVSNRAYFKRAMSTDEEYVISTPVSSRTDSLPITLICYPIYNDANKKIGFINGAISLNKLSEITESIDFYNGTSWIMDSKGNLYSSNPIQAISTAELTSLVSHIKEPISKKVGIYSFKEEGKEQVVFYSPIPYSNGWFLCTMTSLKELNLHTQHLIYTILVIWILMLTISIISCSLFSRTITAPIHKLSKAMQLVKDGNFVLPKQVVSNKKDELAFLTNNFYAMTEQISFLMERIKEEEIAKRTAEFQALQSQINPHFLYNTLDNLQWRAYDYNAIELSEMIEALSDFFRISLSDGKEFIPVIKEIEHIRSYLFIQQKRYEDILNFTISYDPDVLEYVTIKLIVQPLVENALYHGIKPKLSPGTIAVRVTSKENTIQIIVQDDGVGMSPAELETLLTSLEQDAPVEGYGLYNIHRRIQMVYGKEYGISITSEEQIGTTATIIIPAVKELQNNETIINCR
jgi:two-component system sensor histidine kinase YesM